VNKAHTLIDALLEPLLLSNSDAQTDAFLSQLITECLQPVIKRVIRYKLHFNTHNATEAAEADDIQQEVTVQILSELQKFRQQPQVHSIGDVSGLAAVITHRACARWLRRQFPERHAFKNRLYYLLTRQRGFAVWQNENRRLTAGFAAWQGQKELAITERLRSLSDDPKLLAQIRLLQTGGQAANSAAVVAQIFDYLGGPVEFDELIGTLADLLRIRDQAPESTDQDENAKVLTASFVATDTAWQVEKRIFLKRLWEEIRQLPLNQKTALLLNLRDAEGRGCISLFPAAGIADVRHLAETLEMREKDFTELWNELPLDDARIAGLLRMNRQQIINLRKSARERLARRLRGFI
jgi:DNA-directed RNA polymerase specialized sigma24 family protein